MPEPQYAPNHTTDAATGFLESNAYPYAFNAERKLQFLEVFKTNGLGIYRTCRVLGIKRDTVIKHYNTDPVFRKAFDEAMAEYTDDLEATSRENALNPKSVIERIFQLKCLLPDKYGQENRPSSTQITINFDGETLKALSKREDVLDVGTLTDTVKTLDNQAVESASSDADPAVPSPDSQPVDSQPHSPHPEGVISEDKYPDNKEKR